MQPAQAFSNEAMFLHGCLFQAQRLRERVSKFRKTTIWRIPITTLYLHRMIRLAGRRNAWVFNVSRIPGSRNCVDFYFQEHIPLEGSVFKQSRATIYQVKLRDPISLFEAFFHRAKLLLSMSWFTPEASLHIYYVYYICVYTWTCVIYTSYSQFKHM